MIGHVAQNRDKSRMYLTSEIGQEDGMSTVSVEKRRWEAHINYGVWGVPPDEEPLATANTLADLLIQLGRVITPELISQIETADAENPVFIELSYAGLE